MVGERCFPQTWGEVGDLAGGVVTDPLEHIDEVGVGIDTLEPAGHQQALDDADALCADLRAGGQPVPSSEQRPTRWFIMLC